MFVHDLIKIKYIREGYLPDHPYNMITDNEMFEAFIDPDEGFFITNYPCPDDAVIEQYEAIKQDVFTHINDYLDGKLELEPWIYSYMLGRAISSTSDDVEIEYINTLMNIDQPITTEYSRKTAEDVYNISTEWLKKMSYKYSERVPTIFGEPHVIKSLRLSSVDVLGG